MPQLASLESIVSKDIPIGGKRAKPERGPGSTFSYDGDIERLKDPSAISKIFMTKWEQADNYRKRFTPEWIKAFQQYQGELDDRNKAPWQNNVNIPLPKQAVDHAASRILDALFQTDDFFDILPSRRIDDVKTAFAKAVIKWQLWNSDARQQIETAVKDALICGSGYLKCYFDMDIDTVVEARDLITGLTAEEMAFNRGGKRYGYQEIERVVKLLRLEPIIPTDMWLDPTGRGEFVIQRIKRNLSSIWQMARDQKDSDGQILLPAVYDPEIVSKVRAGIGDQRSNVEAAVIRRDTPHLQDDLGVDLYEYWGHLTDPSTGVVLFRNIVATFADKQFTIRYPQPNPFLHRKAPFVRLTPEERAHEIYGVGILFPSLRLVDAVQRHWNVVLDKTLLSVPAVEIDQMAAKNPEELQGDKLHYVPGKTFTRKSPDRQIFYPVEGFMPPTDIDLAITDRLASFIQMGTDVTEFVTGQTQTTNRKTKEEVQARTQAAQQTFNSAARHIEQHALGDLLEMVYYLVLQFVDDFDDETLMKMIGDDQDLMALVSTLKDMEPEERWYRLYLKAEFRVTAVTNNLTRQDRMSRLSNFEKIVQADPTLGPLLDKRERLRQWMQLLEIDKKLLLPQADAMMQAAESQQLQMMSQPPQQPGSMEGQNPHNQMAGQAANMNNMPPGGQQAPPGGPPQ